MRRKAARPRIVTTRPLNAETPAAALASAFTPAESLFVRNHHDPPKSRRDWSITVRDARGATSAVRVAELARRRRRSVALVLECAGNGRSDMRPVPPGTPWGRQALGCVVFEGVPLRSVLPKARLAGAREVVFTGADETKEGRPVTGYRRSLPVDVALRPDVILATRMNRVPLRREHGGPVRLVVPGWYGMASVKWLASIEASPQPFSGIYQTDHYVYYQNGDGGPDAPVTHILPKSLIAAPAEGDILPVGRAVQVWGWAWAGRGLRFVEVSFDDGATWKGAKLGPSPGPYAWRKWSLAWVPRRPGAFVARARATDSEGAVQPLVPPWNKLGYGNNVAPRLAFSVHAKRTTTR